MDTLVLNIKNIPLYSNDRKLFTNYVTKSYLTKSIDVVIFSSFYVICEKYQLQNIQTETILTEVLFEECLSIY